MKKFTALVFCLACGFLWAGTSVFTVDVDGYGASHEMAVANALCEAIRQVNGTTIDSQKELASLMLQNSKTINGESTRTVNLTQTNAEQLSLLTKGAVKSYRINSCTQEDTGWVASLSVDIAQYETPGLSPDSRRKIAMSPFQTTGSQFSVGGTALPSSKVSEDLLTDFNRHFTQSRRFAVLSRQDNAAIEKEKQLIASQSPIEEIAKLGKTLGLDYLVTGKIKSLYISEPEVKTISISGASKTVIDRAFIDVEYRIIVVATSQIKWADSITIDLPQEEITPYGSDVFGLYQLLKDYASQGIAQAIDNIYPMRAIKYLDNGEIVLDRGGSLLEPGMYFDAFKLGEMVYDPVNNEPLGQPEIKLAVVQIMRVDSKLSYCRVVPGFGAITPENVEGGIILRAYREPFPTPQEQADTAAAAKATIQPPPSPQPLKLPFDK